MAQWIRHLTTNQGIPGSSPGRVASKHFFFSLLLCFFFLSVCHINEEAESSQNVTSNFSVLAVLMASALLDQRLALANRSELLTDCVVLYVRLHTKQRKNCSIILKTEPICSKAMLESEILFSDE